MERWISLLGLFSMIFLAWGLSADRKRFPWRLVFWGLGLQLIFCILILGIPALGISGPLRFLFVAANRGINAVIDFTLEGSRFVFGDLMDAGKFGFVFAFQVLPTIIFIGALMSLFYHWRVMQKITFVFAWVMQKTMKTSGAETLAASANIFVGQTEAPLVIKPYISGMTRSELLCLMVGGMANTAGGVMAAYVGLLRDRVPDIAGHLLTASVISAPAALLIAKVMMPERETPETFGTLPREVGKSPHANSIDAAAQGALEGLTLAANVAAMLIAFIALIALANGALGSLGAWVGYEGVTFQGILGWIFAPVVWLIGIPADEVLLAGSMLGEKTVLNEFVAFVSLAEAGPQMSERSFIIMSYALSGFANFSSIAIQIGGISPLAPHRRADLAQLGLRAMIGGTLATLMTGAMVGLFL